jgi:hypothetical protein
MAALLDPATKRTPPAGTGVVATVALLADVVGEVVALLDTGAPPHALTHSAAARTKERTAP